MCERAYVPLHLINEQNKLLLVIKVLTFILVIFNNYLHVYFMLEIEMSKKIKK